MTIVSQERRRRLFLTGASGLLGGALLDRFAAHWDITALVGRHRIVLPGIENVVADLSEPSMLPPLVENARPDVVLHSAAWTDLDGCESNPLLARTLHRDASLALAGAAAKRDSAFIYISTDSLFSQSPGPHREEDPIDPRSVYAKTKREGEEVSLAVCPKALVLRTCIIGWNAQRKLSLAEWIVRELREGRTLKAFKDVWFTPILTTAFATAIESLIEREARGILHVAGGECVSKYEFALRIADIFELPRNLVVPSSITDVDMKAPRPRAPCLSSSRFSELTGQRLQTIEDAIREFRRQEEVGWHERIRAAIAP